MTIPIVLGAMGVALSVIAVGIFAVLSMEKTRDVPSRYSMDEPELEVVSAADRLLRHRSGD